MSKPSWLQQGEIPSLAGLRGIAVLLVVLAHAHQTAGFPNIQALHAIGSRGAIGVDIFFVLSGFLITVLLLREKNGAGQISVSQFYLRRILRIVPAYLALLLVVALANQMELANLTGTDWLAALTYTVNFVHKPAWEIGHAWSLSIEEHFYLAWPILAALSLTWARHTALALIGLCFAGRWLILLFLPEYTSMAELWTFTRLDSIAAGCLLGFLAFDMAWRDRLDRICNSNLCLCVIAAGLLTSVCLSSSGKWSVGMAYSVNAICLALLIWAAVRRPASWGGRLLNHWTLRFVGAISYSLYLWQQLFLNPTGKSVVQTFPQNVLLALLAAWVCYRVVERPFLLLKQRLGREPLKAVCEPARELAHTAGDSRTLDPVLVR